MALDAAAAPTVRDLADAGRGIMMTYWVEGSNTTAVPLSNILIEK